MSREPSPFGQGWSLPLGEIHRSTKGGVPTCATTTFDVSLPNGSFELVAVVPMVPNTYHARVDEAFLLATYDPTPNTWTLVDRSGMTYRFGLEGAQDHARDVTNQCTMLWALSELEDPNGNKIAIHYEKTTATAIYPKEVLYGGNPDADMSEHPYKVTFDRIPRTYRPISFATGSRIVATHLINVIKVQYRPSLGQDFEDIRTYSLNYHDVPETGAALLDTVQGTDLPVQRFEYSAASAYGIRETVTNAADGLMPFFVRLHNAFGAYDIVRSSVMDINGDGIPDVLTPSGGSGHQWFAHMGSPDGYSTAEYIQLLSSIPDFGFGLGLSMTDATGSPDSVTRYETQDLTGDGIPDLIVGGSPDWTVYRSVGCSGTGCVPPPGDSWPSPGGNTWLGVSRSVGVYTHVEKSLLDMNGDGLADFVVAAEGVWSVYMNTGDGFSTVVRQWSPVPGAATISTSGKAGVSPNETADEYRGVFDMNGDGLPDIVDRGPTVWVNSAGEIVPQGQGSVAQAGQLLVFLNNGVGFGEGPGWSSVKSAIPISQSSNPLATRVRKLVEGASTWDQVEDFFDVNGDGLPDYLHRPAGSPNDQWYVQYNQGGGRLEPLVPTGGAPITYAPHVWNGFTGCTRRTDGPQEQATAIDFLDWNGDGILDRVEPLIEPHHWKVDVMGRVAGSSTLPPNLLVRATSGRSETEIRYAPSSTFDNTGGDAPDLPTVLWVVTGIRSTDGLCQAPSGAGTDRFDPEDNPCIGLGHEIVKTIKYEGGLYHDGEDSEGNIHLEDREFRGFRTVTEAVTETDSASGTQIPSNETVTTFSQADFTRGKVELIESYLGPATLGKRISQVRSTYEVLGANPGRVQVYMTEQRTEAFAVESSQNSQSQCSITRNNPPDAYGRVGLTCSMDCAVAPPSSTGGCTAGVIGQVDTESQYATSSGVPVLDRPSRVTVRYTNPTSVVIKLTEQEFDYDGLPNGSIAAGNLTEVRSSIDSSSHTTSTMIYDPFGNILTSTDPRGHATSFTYDPAQFSLYATKEQRPTTGTVEHEILRHYDLRHGKIDQLTDENQSQQSEGEREVSAWTYDSLGRVLTETRPGDAAGCSSFCLSRQYVYTWASETATDFEGMLNRVEVRTREPNRLGTNGIDGYVRSLSAADSLGRPRFAKSERVIGGSNLAVALKFVVAKHTQYDSAGRPERVFSPYELENSSPVTDFPPGSTKAATTYDYILNGNATGSKDPRGRPHIITPPDDRLSVNRKTTVLYEGRTTRTINSSGGESIETVDHLGRVIAKSTANTGGSPAPSFEYELDGAGRPLRETLVGVAGSTRQVTYDLLGRKTSMLDPDSGPNPWIYGYDPAGNLTYQDDPKGGQHLQMAYDALGRITARCTYSFDVEVIPNDCSPSATNAITRYFYDDTEAGNFGIGRLTKVLDSDGGATPIETRMRYDNRGRTTQHYKAISAIPATTDFAYDAADHLVSITYPDGELVNYGYDSTGAPKSVASSLATYVSNTAYDRFGRATQILHGNGSTDFAVFWGKTRNFGLKSLKSAASSGEVFLEQTYDYDEHGKVSTISDLRHPSGSISNSAGYTYDNAGRLTDADYSEGVENDESYGFDSAGNLDDMDGKQVLFSPSAPHQPTGFDGGFVTHDQNGMRTAKGYLDGGGQATNWQAITYDRFGRATRLQVGLGVAQNYDIRYAYDYNDRRVRKTVNSYPAVLYFSNLLEYTDGEITKYYFLGNRLIATRFDPAESMARLLAGASLRPPELWGIPVVVAGPGLLLALLMLAAAVGPKKVRIGVAVARSRALGAVLILLWGAVPLVLFAPVPADAIWCGVPGTIRHYHPDHLGSALAISDNAGSLQLQIRYSPYGKVRGRYDAWGGAQAPSEMYRYEFTTYESIHNTGLQYAGARFYDPGMGQFLSHDPAALFASPYAYGSGDPMNETDPGGSEPISTAVALLIFAVSIAVGQFLFTGASTGKWGQAAIGLGISIGTIAASYGLGSVLSLSIGPLVNAHPAIGYALAAASAGYAGYGFGSSLVNGDFFGATNAGLALVGLAAGMLSERGSVSGESQGGARGTGGGGVRYPDSIEHGDNSYYRFDTLAEADAALDADIRAMPRSMQRAGEFYGKIVKLPDGTFQYGSIYYFKGSQGYWQLPGQSNVGAFGGVVELFHCKRPA